MKCRDIRKLLSPYLEGELEEQKKGALEVHLKGCPVCRKELTLLEAAIQSVRDLDEVAPPANLLAKINEELDKRLLRSRLSLIREKITRPIDMPVLAKSMALAASILLILYLAAGPGQIYRTFKISSQITSPAKVNLRITEAKLSISHPVVNIPRPGSHCITPAKMAEARRSINVPTPSYSVAPETMKDLNYPCLNFYNPAAMAKVRKALGFSSFSYSVSPRNSKQ